jgi:two-component system cell cycle sensor histidine kinase/response regulator CckA
MSPEVSPRRLIGAAVATLAVAAGLVTAAAFFLSGGALPAVYAAMAALLVAAVGLAFLVKLAAQLRQTREEFERASEQTDLLLEALPASTLILTPDRKILCVNRQAEKLFGFKRGELEGKELDVLVPDRVEELFAASTIDSGLGQVSALNPLRHRQGKRKDGRRVPLEVRIRPLRWQGQDAFLGFMRDATEIQETEASLRQAEAKFQSIFENAGEGIYQVSAEGRFLTANPALARMLGYDSPEELMAKVTDVKKQVFVEPNQRSMIRLLTEQVGRARGFEYQAYCKGGTKIWVLGNQRAVRDAGNKIVYYEGNIEEITERKRAEEALRESQRALLTLMSNLPGMAYRCRNDRQRTMEFVSEGGFELAGRSPADFLQNRVAAFGDLIHPEDRERLWNEIQEALRDDRPYQIEYRLQVEGRDKMVWEQGRGVRSVTDQAGLMLEGLIIDVNERARARENLRKSEEQFRQLAENINGVFWMTNLQASEVIYVSQAYEKIWDRSRASLYKSPGSWMEPIDPQDLETVRAGAGKMMDGGFDVEYRIHRRDGEVRWIWDRAFPIADDKGQTYRRAGIAQDITERKRLEDQYRQAQKMEAVGRLAGGIAHDFNNLLCIMNGYSDLLTMSLSAGSEAHGYAERIGKAGERAANLTRQLLAFSRKTVLIPKVLNLNDLLTPMEELVRRLIGEDIAFSLKLDPALGKIEADPGQLEQVLMNLIINARDAMATGGQIVVETANVTLDAAHVQNREGVRAGDYVMMAVRDTGEGMGPAQLARIFEPFFTTKEVGKGTGLGLAMVYGVVKQSGGDVEVESEVGKGSCFRVYLPRVPDATNGSTPPAMPEPTSATQTAPTTHVDGTRGKETILLVEDEELVREMARGLLIKSGYTVLEAGDGKAALDVAGGHAQPIDLLITDVVMPRMNGPDLERHLTTARPGIRVLFTTGYTDSTLSRYGMFERGKTVLLKPFSPDDFLRMVREVLDG